MSSSGFPLHNLRAGALELGGRVVAIQFLLAALFGLWPGVPVNAQPAGAGAEETIGRLGPRVLEFSRRKTVRGKPEAKIDVVVFALPALSETQRSKLEDLGIDAARAVRGGSPLAATPGVLRALSRLDFVVHIDDRHLTKMDSTIASYLAALDGGRPGDNPAALEVEVTLHPDLSAAQRQTLASFGLNPQAIAYDRVVGEVQAQRLEQLAAQECVLGISLPSEEEQQQAPRLPTRIDSPAELAKLHQRGWTGKGVKVAVIDGDFDPKDPRLAGGGVLYAETIGAARNESAASKAHGTAVAAILRVVAPEAQLILLSVGSAPGGNVYRAIDRALALEADVINVSLGKAIPEESFLRGDGPLAQALGYKLAKRGTSLVVAAGNYNRSLAYLADGGRFDGRRLLLGPQQQTQIRFFWPRRLPDNQVFVAWDDEYAPVARRASDLTLEVREARSGKVVGFSNDNQLGSKPPKEVLRLARPGSANFGKPGFIPVTGGGEYFAIAVGSAMPPQTMRGRALRVGVSQGAVLESPSNAASISAAPYALAAQSLMVGALEAKGGKFAIAPHSGRGPQLDGLPRPDVLARDAGALLRGTSAAAPFVSGVVAMLKSLQPDLKPPEIRELLKRTAGRGEAGGIDPVAAIGAVVSANGNTQFLTAVERH
ncbi:S8 family serine peptidase [Gloeobacter morelensis]|uniref:S8 family serine peptidase n=1 Tax=Gloeobacter morelensis MG652769 TaxID=2781736 RepID=A0ABY3PSQ4_9CYAN|nr:S8 family serine peptidase [Gloeobacter morelensis]UFP96685.1 S8 family serine peptidase [Gloeobacter morelensis MG652769]